MHHFLLFAIFGCILPLEIAVPGKNGDTGTELKKTGMYAGVISGLTPFSGLSFSGLFVVTVRQVPPAGFGP